MSGLEIAAVLLWFLTIIMWRLTKDKMGRKTRKIFIFALVLATILIFLPLI